MNIEMLEPDVEESAQETQTALAVQDRAAIALASTRTEVELLALAQKFKTITEIKDKAGRDQAHSGKMELKRARTGVEKAGKVARDDATKFSKAVIAEEGRLIAIVESEEVRLARMVDEWDAIAAKEKAARERVERDKAAAIQSAIDWIKEHVLSAVGQPAARIAEMSVELAAVEITLEQYGGRTGEAEVAKLTTVERLQTMALQAAELEQQAEQLRLEREAFEAEQAEFIARKAEVQRKEEAQRAELAAQEQARAAAAKAETDRIAAEAREAERKFDEARAEADRKAKAERDEADRRAADERELSDRIAREARELEEAIARRLRDAAIPMLQALMAVSADDGFMSLSEKSRTWVLQVVEFATGETP